MIPTKQRAYAHIPLSEERPASINVPFDLTKPEAEKLKKLVDLLTDASPRPEFRIKGVTI